MATVGMIYLRLKETVQRFKMRFSSYENQRCACVLSKNVGGIEIYSDPNTNQVLRAKLF